MHDAYLAKVTKTLIGAAGLPAIPQVYEEVAARCLSLLRSSVESWRSDGLIVQGNKNSLVKCPLFQELWDQTGNVPPNITMPVISTTGGSPADFDEIGFSPNSVTPTDLNPSDGQLNRKVWVS